MRNAMKMGPHASPWRSSSAIVPPRPASHPPPCAPEKKKEEEAQLDLAAVAGAASFASNRIRAMTSTPGSPLTPARPSSTSHHSRARSVSSVPQEELLPPDAASGGTSPFPFNIPLSPKVNRPRTVIKVRSSDGRIVAQRIRRGSFDRALEMGIACFECTQKFSQLSIEAYSNRQCAECQRLCEQNAIDEVDEYDLWLKQDDSVKLQWPKNVNEDESLVRACGYPRELGSRDVSPNDVGYRHINRTPPYYKRYIFPKEHDNYLVALEDGKEPAILSVESSSAKRQGKKLVYKAILRTARGDERFLVQGPNANKKPKKPKIAHIRRSHESLRRDSVPLMLVSGKELANDLAHFEARVDRPQSKIGVLYARPGQITEDEIYGNEVGSDAFETFLLFLGQKVELKKHTGFAGGLSTKGAATGEYSIYTKFQDIEIMFHVATYIPFTLEDRQQVERKRHLGNDIVVLIFRDGSNSSDGFDALKISSHFNHTFIVVEPVLGSCPLAYRVGLVYKTGVRPCKPFLPYPPVFEANDTFRRWLLTKMINSELASLHSPEFLSVLRRTRRDLLREIIVKHDTKLIKV